MSCYAFRSTQHVIRGASAKLTAEMFSGRAPKGFPTNILASARLFVCHIIYGVKNVGHIRGAL
jgi:hypothetical protein